MIEECVSKIYRCMYEDEDKFIIETIIPYCETMTSMEISKEQLISALNNYAKYEWHDLRKNPYDLPLEDVVVNIKYGEKYASAKYTNVFHDGYQWSNELCYFTNVIAWRYIEPFEEV